MNNTTMQDIVKEAILFEMRGESLYKAAAQGTPSPSAKTLFTTLATEEKSHAHFLAGFLKDPVNLNTLGYESAATRQILDGPIVAEIQAAGFEAAVISAAIELELKSSEYYKEKALQSSDADTRRFFDWLADWEKGHLFMLQQLDNALKEKIWHDHQFWPLD